ncbi:ribbon-helix-helix protein, CopG family [Puniceicoccaceae bacterium K14]|nr:ribbon-helix-helix protein, CopG family [Puniceicoccaceae bacterium K14]
MKLSENISVRITEEMLEALKEIAEKEERTVRWVLRKVAEEGLIARGALKKKKSKG